MATKEGATEPEDMKTKQIFALIVGITSVVFSPMTWAAPHGGGGGGFHGGGGFGGGHFGGGSVARGGGSSFRASPLASGHFSYILPGHSFSTYALRQSRISQAAVAAPNRRIATQSPRAVTTLNRQQARLTTNRPASSSIARNSGATSASARPSRTFSQRALNGRTDHISERHQGSWHGDWDHKHAHFHNGRFFVYDDGFWYGLDDGFFPWDYLPYYADDYYPYDYYADAEPNDSPADGIFGPATRDALARYQIAKQLNVTGSLSPDTLQSLQLPQGTQS
jgi:hypothetical protein